MIEELYLDYPSLLGVIELAKASDRESKLQALNDIEKIVGGDGITADDRGILELLEYLSGEGVARTVRENRRTVNYYPIVRRRAIELMGKLGAKTTDDDVVRLAIDTLLDVLIRDPEVMVKAEAAYALGVIGVDDEGRVVRTLADMISRQTAVGPDNNFAYAVCLAIDMLARKNQGIRHYQAYTALVTIMQGNYTRAVKEKAFEVLQALKEYAGYG
jgi:hypothetical protein